MFSAARTVVAFGLIFQLAGLGKLLIIARYFGAGPVLDAYYLGLVIPTLLAGLAAALLQIGFVPAYIEAKTRKDEQSAARIRNESLTYAALLLVVAAAVISVAARPIMALLWPHMAPGADALLRTSFGLLIWTTPITGLIDGFALLLNAERRFIAAAAAPVTNVTVSAFFIVLSPEKSLHVLMWSLFAGLAAQVAVLALALGRGGIRFVPRLSPHPGIARSFLSIGLPVFIASLLANSIPAFIQVMAARSGTGAVSAYGYASRLQRSVVQAIVTSVSTVLLPHFARLLAEGRQEELRENLHRVLAAATIFYFAALTFVVTGGRATVALLLQHGRFTAADGRLVYEVWLALTTGLLGTTWGIFLARLFQAKRRPWVITLSGVVSLSVNVALSLLLMKWLGIVGIALANSIAYLAVMTLFHVLAARSLGRLIDATTLRFVALAAAVNAMAGFGALFLRRVLAGEDVIFIIMSQAALIAGLNLALARCRPLRLAPATLFRL